MVHKFLLLPMLGILIPVSAACQTAESSCTLPGYPGAQTEAVTRTGIGTAYTLSAIIKADLPDSKGQVSRGSISSFQARDSQGRTRVDIPSYCSVERGGRTRWGGSVVVKNPVARTLTSWEINPNFPSQTAILTTYPAGLPPSKEPSAAQDEYLSALRRSEASDHDPDAERHIKYKAEDLGKRTIAGLPATGMRITQTYPAGLAAGNPTPSVEVEERWISDQYRVILLDMKTNSLLGTSIYEVTSFSVGEPDPSFFLPPHEYNVRAQ